MNYIYRSLIVLLLLALVSCSESFLEVEPGTSVSVEEGLNSPDKIEAFLNGLYDTNSSYYYRNHVIMNNDVKGGDALVKASGNYSRYPVEYQFNESPSASYVSDEIWPRAYNLIAGANQIIKNVPGVALSDDEKNAYLAEARALRALAHFDLVQMFSVPYAIDKNSLGIPVVLTPLGPDDATPARGTVAEVYDAILADLLFAEANMDAGKTERSKITLPAIQGLLARVYMVMEDWSKARDYAHAARQGFTLMSATEWLAGFADPTSEWMWYVGHTSDDNNGYLAVASFYDWRVVGYRSFLLDKDFVEAFSSTDIRGNDAIYTYSSSNKAYVTQKFLHRSSWDMQQVMMRASEMYLIEAEAEAELGNDDAAQDLLFAIQSRADADVEPTGNTGEDLLQEIYLERRRELYGEGFRYTDLQRRGEDLVRNASGGHWSTGTISISDYRRQAPLPQTEIDASHLTQNPGYN